MRRLFLAVCFELAVFPMIQFAKLQTALAKIAQKARKPFECVPESAIDWFLLHIFFHPIRSTNFQLFAIRCQTTLSIVSRLPFWAFEACLLAFWLAMSTRAEYEINLRCEWWFMDCRRLTRCKEKRFEGFWGIWVDKETKDVLRPRLKARKSFVKFMKKFVVKIFF